MTVGHSLIRGRRKLTGSRADVSFPRFPPWRHLCTHPARFSPRCQSRAIWLEKTIPLALRAPIMNGRYNQISAGYQPSDTYSTKQGSRGCQEYR